jgi:hypothetical protein
LCTIIAGAKENEKSIWAFATPPIRGEPWQKKNMKSIKDWWLTIFSLVYILLQLDLIIRVGSL